MSLRRMRILDEYFNHKPYRHVQIGEKIESSDVFVVDSLKIHSATDIGNGVMSQDHWPHYRETT